jgi:hypothetical protein
MLSFELWLKILQLKKLPKTASTANIAFLEETKKKIKLLTILGIANSV